MTIQWISEHYRWMFLPLGGFHLLLFISLQTEHARRLLTLRTFVRNLATRIVHRWSDERPNSTVAEELDILLHDLRDALPVDSWDPERAARIRDAVFAADAPRTYLYEMDFEKRHSLAKAITETYPLLGIVGTVLAIAAGMAPMEAVPPRRPDVAEVRTVGAPAVSEEDHAAESSLRQVTQNFGHSVWTTLVGLSLAVVFLLVNAWSEPEFHQLGVYRARIIEILHQVKVRLDTPQRSTDAPRPISTRTNIL